MSPKRTAKKSKKAKANPQDERERALLDELREVAGKLGVEVVQDQIQSRGIRSQGGCCRVGDQWMILIDRRLPVSDQVDLLASELGRWPLDDVFVSPAIRDLLQPRLAVGE